MIEQMLGSVLEIKGECTSEAICRLWFQQKHGVVEEEEEEEEVKSLAALDRSVDFWKALLFSFTLTIALSLLGNNVCIVGKCFPCHNE